MFIFRDVLARQPVSLTAAGVPAGTAAKVRYGNAPFALHVPSMMSRLVPLKGCVCACMKLQLTNCGVNCEKSLVGGTLEKFMMILSLSWHCRTILYISPI